jgi:hypothetical protein
MGGLKDKAESFRIENMTPKQADLFFKCWEHNFSWRQTLLQKYLWSNNGFTGYGLRFLFTYGCKEAKKLINKCKKEYNHNIASNIKDQRTGEQLLGLHQFDLVIIERKTSVSYKKNAYNTGYRVNQE